MTDTFNLTASYDATSYTAGTTAKLTVSGTVTSPVAGQIGPLTVTVTASDGQVTTLSVPAENVTGSSNLTWAITNVADSSGHIWAIATDGHSATTTA